MADPHPIAPQGRGPSDICPGPGWWQASDGKWYPPEARPGGGWWQASDAKCYPPEARPGGGWWQASDGKWYPPEAPPGGGWSASPQGFDQWRAGHAEGVLPRTPRHETLQLTGWILLGASAFIGFVGLFSGQNASNAQQVDEAEVFAMLAFVVAVPIAITGLVLIWRSQRS